MTDISTEVSAETSTDLEDINLIEAIQKREEDK